MPTLLVLRHAKAASVLGLADIERPLTDRGRRDATGTGDWLRKTGLLPDRVLCSPSHRTRETLERLALDADDGTAPGVAYESGIYDNDADALFALLRESADEAAVLLLIGHNPSLHQLVHDLAGDAPDRFPTCALAVIDVPGSWPDIRPGQGVIKTYRTPKG